MAPSMVTLCKFVGTISLGLLTGVSYTLTTTTLPSLLTLPTATSAHTTFLALQTLAKQHLVTLTAISTTSLVLAFGLSPSRARHPYLIWTALTAAAGGAVDFALRHNEEEVKALAELGEGEEINGEEVRTAVEKFRFVETVRAGVSGLAFGMGIIGIWGDGF